MYPTESKVEEVLATKDEDLNNVEEAPTEANDNTQSTESTTNSTNSDNTDSTETGFTANEAVEESTETTEETPQAPQALDPETQYLVDNLPTITARIVKDGQVSDLQVKSWTQLPQDVEFATKRDELSFLNALTAQEAKARELQQDFRNQQQQKESNDFEQRENAAIRQDITELQEAGKLPKFKVDPGKEGFEDDPGTKEVQNVLDFMNKKNEEYLNRYNNGYAYRHIGFNEAYEMMPETKQKEAKDAAQTQEDKARQQTNRVQPPTGQSQMNIKKATVKQGTTLDDIVNKYDQEF